MHSLVGLVIAKTPWPRKVAGSFDKIEWFISRASGNEQRGERYVGHKVKSDIEDSTSNSTDGPKEGTFYKPEVYLFVAQMKLYLWYYGNSKFA